MKLRDSRVLVVSSSYPASERDFRARFVHEFSCALQAHGAEVQVVTPATLDGDGVPATLDGIGVSRFHYAPRRLESLTGRDGVLNNLSAGRWRVALVPPFLVAFAAAVRRSSREFAPDLVLAHWLLPAGLVGAVALPREPAVVSMAHGSEVRLLEQLPAAVSRRLLGRLCARGHLVSTSAQLGRRLELLASGRQVAVVPLGVAASHPPREFEVSRGLRLLSMGRLVKGKGVERCIDVVARCEGASLTIAGEGPLEGQLRAQVARAAMGAKVRFCAPVVGPAKTALFAQHDVFLFLGDAGVFEDNLPVSALEALAHGVPVLATRVGALPELLSGGGGRLVDASPASIGALLSSLSTAQLTRWSREAVRVAGERSWSASLGALERVLNAESAGGGPGGLATAG